MRDRITFYAYIWKAGECFFFDSGNCFSQSGEKFRVGKKGNNIVIMDGRKHVC